MATSQPNTTQKRRNVNTIHTSSSHQADNPKAFLLSILEFRRTLTYNQPPNPNLNANLDPKGKHHHHQPQPQPQPQPKSQTRPKPTLLSLPNKSLRVRTSFSPTTPKPYPPLTPSATPITPPLSTTHIRFFPPTSATPPEPSGSPGGMTCDPALAMAGPQRCPMCRMMVIGA